MSDPGGGPRIVLDTNVVLDWLLFDDPGARGIRAAIVTGSVRWIATTAMRDEYFAVLQRPIWKRWSPEVARHRQAWDAHCKAVDAPDRTSPPRHALRCADPDDQMFVDLAVSERPDWLLSRDNALLALAPRLRDFAVRVETPAAWTANRLASGTAAT